MDQFGWTFRSPSPLPSGYWLAPLVALAVVAGVFLRPYDRTAVRNEKPQPPVVAPVDPAPAPQPLVPPAP